MTDNPFDRLARFYDWDHADLLDDLPFYRGLAERLGGPILEAACGSGRLLIPLAQAGHEVVGLDSSAAMLALARDRLGAQPGLSDRVELVEGDLRLARLGRRFGLIILALDAFGLLVERTAQLEALETLRQHLRVRGLLAIDVANGNLRGAEGTEETVIQRHGPFGPTGASLTRWVVRRTDHGTQVDRLLQLYDETGPDGVVRRTAVELQQRYFTRFELELLLERAGYVVEAVFGDYDLTPFGPASPRLLVIAHAVSGKPAGRRRVL